VGFPAELKTKIGEQKIDVVFDNANTRQKDSFFRIYAVLRKTLNVSRKSGFFRTFEKNLK
jgi:hypothetical protein